jgi:hypothetical protein
MLLSNRRWSVSSAYYVNAAGQKIQLLDPYDTKVLIPLLVA